MSRIKRGFSFVQMRSDRHGSRPFYQFRIPSDMLFESVYFLDVDGENVYAGSA